MPEDRLPSSLDTGHKYKYRMIIRRMDDRQMRTRNVELNHTRRAAIIAAASTCFVQRGFHATSMKDVCIAAGMSPGTMYHYFRSKADIIRGIVEDEREFRRDLLSPLAGSEDFLTTFFNILDKVVEHVSDQDLALQAEVAAEIVRQPTLREHARANDIETWKAVSSAIRTAQAQGRLDDDLNPDHAARLVTSTIEGMLSVATLHGLEQLHDQMPSIKSALARMLKSTDGAT